MTGRFHHPEKDTMGALMLALILTFFVLFVGAGLIINVYLYTHHAIRSISVKPSLDDQLFDHYTDVDTREIW